MPKRFQLLVFDWDGTLADSTFTIVEAIRHAFIDNELEPPVEENARHIIGLSLIEAVKYLRPQLTPIQYQQLIDRYRYHYLCLSKQNEVALFAGVAEALNRYKQAGFQLAVATGKGRTGLDRSLLASQLHDYFEVSRCADETFSKPHPAMLLEIMEHCGTHPEHTLMIGDTSHDLQMAINAKVAAVGVSYGAHTREYLLEFNLLACMDSFKELDCWIMANA